MPRHRTRWRWTISIPDRWFILRLRLLLRHSRSENPLIPEVRNCWPPSSQDTKWPFTAARQIFEGRKGFLAAMSNDSDETMLIENLGADYHMLTNSFKRHASCRHTHTAIDATLVLRNEKKIGAGDVDAIQVYLYPAG